MTLTITATQVPPVGGPPGVRLDVASTTASPKPVPANSQLVIWRIHEDGTEHRVLTGSDPRVIGGSWVGIDYHAPYNAQLTYRVEAAGSTATAPTYVGCQTAWLIHQSEPALSVCVDSTRSIGTRSTKPRAGRFAPPGELPIFISSGARDGQTGNIVVAHADLDAIEALTQDDPLILISTPGAGWRIKWMWVQPGQIDYDNPGAAWWPWDIITIPWEQAQEPDVDVVNAWNAGAAAAYFRSIGVNAGQVKTRYANAAAFKTNTPL